MICVPIQKRSVTIARWFMLGIIAGSVTLIADSADAQTSDASRTAIAANPLIAAAVEDAQHGWYKDSLATQDQRLAWWRDARFGCFIHWGVYSGPGGVWNGKNVGGYAEHLMRLAKIPLAQYKQEVVAPFDPEKLDADAWASLIKSAGMRYVVITSKHHDGFAMWPSDAYPYDIRLTKFKRDPMAGMAAACHKAGLKFGFYYSHALDWENPDAPGNDWEYKNPSGDKHLFGDDWQTAHPELVAQEQKYVDEKAIPQLKELIAKYHPDIFWFDVPNHLPPSLQLRILKAVRLADPNVLINGRGTSWPLKNYGDYADTADRPAEVRPTPGNWECIPTCNESYGYHQLDNNYKPVSHFIQLIAKVAAKGGNTLLNIGPMGDGEIEPHSAAILQGIGKWMDVNSESIRGSQRTPLDRQAWGDSTMKGNTLYLHVFNWPKNGRLIVGGLKNDVTTAYLLSDPQKSPLKTERENESDLLVNLPAAAPDAVDSVIVLQLDGPAQAVIGRLLATDVPFNQLLAYDGTLGGDGYTYGDGKTSNYWIAGLIDPAHTISWNARLNAAATFDVIVKYSTKTKDDGGTYDLTLGDQTLHGKVTPTSGVKDLATVTVGSVTLTAGSVPVRITPTQVNGKGLFNLFEIDLVPKDEK